MSGNVLKRVANRVKRIVYRPRVSTISAGHTIWLGTPYGGREFIDLPSLHGATIISAGLGEDASFDVEFAARYKGKVLIVDPTPRAITHYDKFIRRLGHASETAYTMNGNLPAESYDLRGLTKEHFELVPKALWTANTTIRFYQPPNPDHVSHSITNFQNNYTQDSPFIEVPTVTVAELIAANDVKQLEIIKLDIEGAETEVLYGMLKSGILPNQILVEFDELSLPSRQSREKFEACDAVLRQVGYECVYWSGFNDFTYAHQRVLSQIG